MANEQSQDVSPQGAPFLTLQQIFDKSLSGLRQQGSKCLDEEGFHACRYRGARGTACGIGHLIPDNSYIPAFDHARFSGVLSLIGLVSVPGHQRDERFCEALRLGGVDPKDLKVQDLLQDIQKAHDRALNMVGIESNFFILAEAHGLTYTPPAAA